MVEEEQWEENGVDDIAMETELLSLLIGTRVTVERAEAVTVKVSD
jgi:hypothetical protein